MTSETSSWNPTAINSKLSRANHLYRTAEAQASKLDEMLEAKRSQLEALEEVGTAVRQLAVQCQSQCQERIGSIVTRCLETIFGESKYTFKLIFEEKRNQTEARCVLLDSEGNEYDPIASTGGGVMDVVAFGLRLACLMLQKPAPAKVLLLDEPFRFLSREYRPAMLALLDSLAEELGMQFIMVTHFEEFCQGNVIEI